MMIIKNTIEMELIYLTKTGKITIFNKKTGKITSK